MNIKNFFAILVILFIPMTLFAILSTNNQTLAGKQSSIPKPKIIKFSSPMCLDCKELKKNLDKTYPKYSNDIELVEIMVQDNSAETRKQIEKYNITLVPTMIILDKDGKKINQIIGNLGQDELVEMMESLINVK